MFKVASEIGRGTYATGEAHHLLHRIGRDRGLSPVVCHPGFSSHYKSFWYSAPEIVSELVRVGHPYASADFSENDEWGNATDVARVVSLWSLVESRYGADSMIALGGSMGGLAMANYAIRNPGEVERLILLTPALDPQTMFDEDVGGFASDITTAFGGRPTDEWTPAARAEDFAAAPFPIHVYGSTDDPYIDYAMLQAFAEEAEATFVSLGAVGHTLGALAGRDLRAVIES